MDEHSGVTLFYLDPEGESRGPVTGPEIKDLEARGEISANILVSFSHREEWMPLGELREDQRQKAFATVWGAILLVVALALVVLTVLAIFAFIGYGIGSLFRS